MTDRNPTSEQIRWRIFQGMDIELANILPWKIDLGPLISNYRRLCPLCYENQNIKN